MTALRIFGLLTTVALTLWSIFWWTMAEKMENLAYEWFDQKIVGQDRTYKNLSISGFPNRIDLTIENTIVNNYQRKFSTSIRFIQFLTLLYNKDLIINVVKPPISVGYMNKKFIIDGDLIRSSLNLNKQKQVNKIVTEGSNLKLVDPNKYVWKWTKLLFASEKEPGTRTPKYKTHLTVNNISFPSSYLNSYNFTDLVDPIIKKISFDGAISFNQDFYGLPFSHKISKVDDLMITIDWGLIKSSITGNLSRSKKNQLNGSLKIKISNWQSLLLVIEEANLLDKKSFKIIKSSLIFIASQMKNRDQSLKIPLNIKNNFIFLGPINIGKINGTTIM